MNVSYCSYRLNNHRIFLDTCYKSTKQFTVGFSKVILPSSAAVIHKYIINDTQGVLPQRLTNFIFSGNSIWIMGGRERLIPKGRRTNVPPVYKDSFTNKIFVLKHDFIESDLKLPFPLAYHCAILTTQPSKRLFIHGGATSLTTPFNGVIIYHFTNNSWTTIEQGNPCMMSKLTLTFEQSQCGALNDNLMVVPTAKSCTAIFDLVTWNWLEPIYNDGRVGNFGGVLIKSKDKLLYLGGRKQSLRNSSFDGTKRVYGQESVQLGIDYKWVYQVRNSDTVHTITVDSSLSNHTKHLFSAIILTSYFDQYKNYRITKSNFKL